jgi:hypothetical protein
MKRLHCRWNPNSNQILYEIPTLGIDILERSPGRSNGSTFVWHGYLHISEGNRHITGNIWITRCLSPLCTCYESIWEIESAVTRKDCAPHQTTATEGFSRVGKSVGVMRLASDCWFYCEVWWFYLLIRVVIVKMVWSRDLPIARTWLWIHATYLFDVNGFYSRQDLEGNRARVIR